MAEKRDVWTYDYKKGNKIIHSGFTDDPERREKEHQRRWPGGHLTIVGAAKTEDGARKWEETKHKTINPRRGK